MVAAAALALALAAAPAEPAPAPGLAPPDPYATALRDAREAWAGRADPARLEAAIAAAERARALRPDAVEPLVLAARAHAFRARAEAAVARGELRDCARTAERALRRASPAWAAEIDAGGTGAAAAPKVDVAGGEALYWMARCTADLARERGISAVLSVSAEVRALLARAAALVPEVDAGGPDRALGAWLAALPSAAGGGAQAARRHFDRARALAPADLTRRVREAETWAVLVQDRALCERLLEEVRTFDLSSAPALAPENALARREAEALRARLDRLF